MATALALVFPGAVLQRRQRRKGRDDGSMRMPMRLRSREEVRFAGGLLGHWGRTERDNPDHQASMQRQE